MRALALGVLVLLVAANLRADSAGYEAPASTVRLLVKALKDGLPQSWSIQYDRENSQVEITRDHYVRATSSLPDQSEQEATEVKSIKFSLYLQLMPSLSKENFHKLKVDNEETGKKLEKLFTELSRGLPYKGDDFVATDDASKKKIAEYERLKGTLHDLPQFQFRDVGLKWIPVDPDSYGFYPYAPVDEVIGKECKGVIKKIEGTLTKY
jgi:hypothetical protein